MAQIQNVGDQLAADSGWLKSVEKGADYFDGPATDGLATLVHGELNLGDNWFEYVSVATATLSTGHLQAGITAGIEIADHVTKVTGDDALFVVNAAGLFGGVAWISPNANAAALDAGEGDAHGQRRVAAVARPGRQRLQPRCHASHAPPPGVKPQGVRVKPAPAEKNISDQVGVRGLAELAPGEVGQRGHGVGVVEQ